jgi:hypothetical protein
MLKSCQHYFVSVATATRTIISDIGTHFSDVKVKLVTSEFCGTEFSGGNDNSPAGQEMPPLVWTLTFHLIQGYS